MVTPGSLSALSPYWVVGGEEEGLRTYHEDSYGTAAWASVSKATCTANHLCATTQSACLRGARTGTVVVRPTAI